MQHVLKSILAQAASWPDRNAVLLADRAITYGMLASGVAAVENRIAGLALDRDKAVGVLVENPARHIIVTLALAKAGYCAVSLHRSHLPLCAALSVPAVLSDTRLLDFVLKIHAVEDDWFVGPAAQGGGVAEPPEDRIVKVEFTSGSTGRPKPVGFTDAAVLNQTLNRIAAYAMRGDAALSLFRVTSNVGFGFALACLMQGRTVCYAGSYDQAIDLLNYHAIADIAASPAQIAGLMARLGATGRTVPAARKIVLAGSQVSQAEMSAVASVFRGDVQIDFGSTETGPVAMASGALLHAQHDGFARLAPLQGVDIVDEADGSVDGAGAVRMRSTGMGWPFTGSLRQTAEDRADGWFHTGDLGRLDEAGRLVLIGRADELVNYGGVKRSPERIEADIRRHAGVADAAVARDGASGGALLVAIVLEDAADFTAVAEQVRQSLRDVGVMNLRQVQAIPRTATDKVDRNALRAEFAR